MRTCLCAPAPAPITPRTSLSLSLSSVQRHQEHTLEQKCSYTVPEVSFLMYVRISMCEVRVHLRDVYVCGKVQQRRA